MEMLQTPIHANRLKICWFLLPLLWLAPAWADPSSDALLQRVEQLEQRVEQLAQRLQQLEQASQAPVAAVSPPEAVEGGSAPETHAQALSLRSWSYRKVQIKFNTYYALDLELHNGYAKSIKEIEGRVQFHNRLGSHLYSIRLTQDMRIPPGGHVLDQGSQENKRLQGEGHPMRNLSSSDIVAELVIKKIVFDDNTMLSF